jgi:hypothetical protein
MLKAVVVDPVIAPQEGSYAPESWLIKTDEVFDESIGRLELEFMLSHKPSCNRETLMISTDGINPTDSMERQDGEQHEPGLGQYQWVIA